MAVLIYVQGVLARKLTPIKDGLGLVRTIQEKQAIILLCEDKAKTEHWLRENKLARIDNIVDHNIPAPGDDVELRQAEYCRSLGPIDYVITANTELASRLLEQGFRVLLFLDPIYLDHRYRPDTIDGRKSWADIKAELDKQADMYLDDPRK